MITYIGKDERQGSAQSFAFTRPAGVVAGDLLIAQVVRVNTANTWTLPSGWSPSVAQAANSLTMWGIADAGTSSYAVSWTAASSTYRGLLLAYRLAAVSRPVPLVNAGGAQLDFGEIPVAPGAVRVGFGQLESATGRVFTYPVGANVRSELTAGYTMIGFDLPAESTWSQSAQFAVTYTAGDVSNDRGVLYMLSPRVGPRIVGRSASVIGGN